MLVALQLVCKYFRLIPCWCKKSLTLDTAIEMQNKVIQLSARYKRCKNHVDPFFLNFILILDFKIVRSLPSLALRLSNAIFVGRHLRTRTFTCQQRYYFPTSSFHKHARKKKNVHIFFSLFRQSPQNLKSVINFESSHSLLPTAVFGSFAPLLLCSLSTQTNIFQQMNFSFHVTEIINSCFIR